MSSELSSSDQQSPQSELDPVELELKWFNGAKGFGFVVPQDGSFDAFLHITTLQELGIHSIGEGAKLLCTITDGDKGKQVKDILEVLDKGAQSLVPVVDEETGLVTMGGLVKWYKPEKGFGFIMADDGMKDIFIHQSCLDRMDIEELRAGQRVKVTLKDVDKGREAVSIEMMS